MGKPHPGLDREVTPQPRNDLVGSQGGLLQGSALRRTSHFLVPCPAVSDNAIFGEVYLAGSRLDHSARPSGDSSMSVRVLFVLRYCCLQTFFLFLYIENTHTHTD